MKGCVQCAMESMESRLRQQKIYLWLDMKQEPLDQQVSG